MATLTAALAALERHAGFPQTRSRQIARRLQEANLLPLGSPGTAPAIDYLGFATLLLAVAADTPVHAAPTTATALLEIQAGGTQLDSSSASLPTIRSEFLALIETALEVPNHLSGCQIEVVSSWPEVAIHRNGKIVKRFMLSGDDGESRGHRTSTTIDGRSFGTAVRSVFKGKV